MSTNREKYLLNKNPHDVMITISEKLCPILALIEEDKVSENEVLFYKACYIKKMVFNNKDECSKCINEWLNKPVV